MLGSRLNAHSKKGPAKTQTISSKEFLGCYSQ